MLLWEEWKQKDLVGRFSWYSLAEEAAAAVVSAWAMVGIKRKERRRMVAAVTEVKVHLCKFFGNGYKERWERRGSWGIISLYLMAYKSEGSRHTKWYCKGKVHVVSSSEKQNCVSAACLFPNKVTQSGRCMDDSYSIPAATTI